MPYAPIPELIMDPSVQRLCVRPYPGHVRGCLNFGKKAGCPPCDTLPSMLDLGMPVYAIWNVFPFGDHARRMKVLHPQWSTRQLHCCLYWQGTARKHLKTETANFREECPGLEIVHCPEARGVDVTNTMRTLGHCLEWPPKEKAYQVILAGTPLADFLR